MSKTKKDEKTPGIINEPADDLRIAALPLSDEAKKLRSIRHTAQELKIAYANLMYELHIGLASDSIIDKHHLVRNKIDKIFDEVNALV